MPGTQFVIPAKAGISFIINLELHNLMNQNEYRI